MHLGLQCDAAARHFAEPSRSALAVVLTLCSRWTTQPSSSTQYQLDRSPRSNLTVSFCCEIFLLADQGVSKAKVVSVKEHEQGRLVGWSGRAPVFDGHPVYDLTLDWQGKKYVVRYESFTGYYPASWAAGQEATVKRERGLFIIFKGQEPVRAREVNPHDCVDASFPGAGSTTPKVPCE